MRSIYIFGRKHIKDAMNASKQPINWRNYDSFSNITWLWYQHSAETSLVVLDWIVLTVHNAGTQRVVPQQRHAE
jgi:hypothetical protein